MGPPDRKRAAIVRAAGPLFLKHGLGGTSMAALAAAAGVAKPTLYAYYPRKQAVFIALAEATIAAWRADISSALAGEGPLAARIAAALGAREKAAMALRAASPHAADLYGPSGAAGTLVAAFEMWLLAQVETALATGGIAVPRLLAQLLLASAAGIGQKARAPAELGPALRLLCTRLLRPEGP